MCWPRHPLYRLSRDQYYSSWKMLQPSYLPEIQIWLVSGYFRQHVWKGKVATQIDEITLRDSREMNYDSKLQNMSWFCYKHVNMLSKTTWSQGSLIIKHYRVQEGNHNRGYWSLVHDLGLAHQLLFREQINQWLGVLGYTYGMEVASLRTTEYFARMHDWFGMIPEEAKLTFSNSRRQLSPNARV